ncbi:GNAT family N-acetyltransferase [Candidatus Tisiphia endosymbiont of Stenodema calcarata]|uniref:GNAT family N-acetyltransferase n=1 Tax=Candidatus Tisiphia endosymbiont of Stenodema calcarata TaxID=3139337 RepID=UPI003CCADCC5
MSKQINTLQDALTYYERICGKFDVAIGEENEDGILKSYIYTDRFRAESLYTTEKDFVNFSDQIKQLFNVTFADPAVMSQYATGKVSTQEEFAKRINEQSFRWNNGYPFAAFLVTDKSNDVVVGYEVIGNGSKEHVGEIAYLFNKEYHRGAATHVGYENVGALILGYGKELAKKQDYVNKTYDEKSVKFVGGEIFTTVQATTLKTNTASKKILENLAFKLVGESYKYGGNRYEFELHYDTVLDAPLAGDTKVILEWE